MFDWYVKIGVVNILSTFDFVVIGSLVYQQVNNSDCIFKT